MKQATVMFAMRMPKDIRRALEKAAEREMRPASHMALKVVADYLVAEGFLRGAGESPVRPSGRVEEEHHRGRHPAERRRRPPGRCAEQGEPTRKRKRADGVRRRGRGKSLAWYIKYKDERGRWVEKATKAMIKTEAVRLQVEAARKAERIRASRRPRLRR